MTERVKLCEFCEEHPAAILCPACSRCYCDGCSEFAHSKKAKKGHKTEVIPEGVVIDAVCPLHSDNPLEMFCVDEVALCCGTCTSRMNDLHEGHNVVKVSDIPQDNEIFSAAEVKKHFADALKCDDELSKKIEEAIDDIREKSNRVREEIRQSFIEAHKMLEEEEGRIMGELERVCNESEEALQKNLETLNAACEYSKVLREANSKVKEMSRLMELNLVSAMEKQRRAMEELSKIAVTTLDIVWDSEARELSFTEALLVGMSKLKGWTWKECPDDVDDGKMYSVDEDNPRIATKTDEDNKELSYIIGNTPLPLNTVTSWSVKILKSRKNDGHGVFIGVAPFDIDQNECDNSDKYEWYFDCCSSVLYSGPPHNYRWKVYGPRKKEGQYFHTGDSVGVVMDTTKGELSFVVDGVNFGAAFEGIPLDKPLVPCVFLIHEGDSVELDVSEVKEIVDSFIPVPPNFKPKRSTWDSITLTWNAVEGALFYQIEVDGSKLWNVPTTSTFTIGGLFAETEHTFRVRAVRGNSVGEWSDVVRGRTRKAPAFNRCVWKKCPDNVGEREKYTVDRRNPRIATKICGGGYCTIIGNTPLPLNKVISWSINILKSRNNNGSGIRIGVAPFDINHNEEDKFGWYFEREDSTLFSGPPHNYVDKEYGPIKEYEEYVRTGDSVGVVMDTIKGDLSFALNGVNLGVAYEGIPLDKPLVPSVLLRNEVYSVELDLSEVKETVVDSSIPVPSNIAAKSTTWDSITVTWDDVEWASFYQVEMDGSKQWDASTTNSFTKRELPPDTEHTFRVRAVRWISVGRWSGAVKRRTQKAPKFSECAWKECFDCVYWEFKYSINRINPRIATYYGDDFCTIIGNTFLPPNTVTSWNIKILKSKENDGRSIYIGVAPYNINQNDENNHYLCGWYLDCYDSALWSGPPHNYSGRYKKAYEPTEEDGQYVREGGSVGVVTDTTKGELSFVLDGVNFGVAYERIPLDKPLVPCVLLNYKGDSVEILT